MQFDYGKSKGSFLRMVLLGLVLISPAFLAGLNQTYIAIALPQMPLNLSDASWFGSLCTFSAPISCLLVGFLIDRLGRKAVLTYSVATSVIGWSLLQWNTPALILLSQVFNGLTSGTVGYASQVYAGECVMVNHVRLRNSFLMWSGVGGSVGAFVSLLLSNFFNYRQIAAVGALLSASLLVIMYRAIPESPAWLHSKGRFGDAEWAARKLRIWQPVLADGPDIIKDVPAVRVSDDVSWSKVSAEAKKLKRPDVYKPVLISVAVNVLLASSGPTTLLTYMINILENNVPGASSTMAAEAPFVPNVPMPFSPIYASMYAPPAAHLPAPIVHAATAIANSTATLDGTVTSTATAQFAPSDANMYSVIIGVLMCLTSLTSCLILPYFGIRNILTTSAFSGAIAFLILALTTIHESSSEALTWRVLAISMVAVMYSLSSGASDSVLGDLLPADAKGFASIVSVCSYLAAAIMNKAFPYLYASIAGHVYVVFTVISISAVYTIRTFMPEVSGKTLDQINREFLKV